MATADLVESVRTLSSTDLERLLAQRSAEDAALRVLLRAAVTRERKERRLSAELSHEPPPRKRGRHG